VIGERRAQHHGRPALLGVEKTVVERVEFDEDEEMLVAHATRLT
jgi:hypothetical protein